VSEPWLSPEGHDAITADAVALADAIVTARLRDPDSPAARNLIGSIIGDLTRDLDSESVEEIITELGLRSARTLVIVDVMANMVVQIIQAAERAGITVNIDSLASPYDVMTGLDDLEP
jgi:hypothetical protein